MCNMYKLDKIHVVRFNTNIPGKRYVKIITNNLSHVNTIFICTSEALSDIWWKKGSFLRYEVLLKQRNNLTFICMLLKTRVENFKSAVNMKRIHRENFSESYWTKPKSDCIYHFPIDLESNGRTFGSKSTGAW